MRKGSPLPTACAVAGPSRCKNILSTGSFSLQTPSSTRVSVYPAQGMSHLREVWTGSLADYAETEPGSGAPAFSQPTHKTEFTCLLTLNKLSASNSYPKVKPECMCPCVLAKSSPSCQ